MVRAAVTEYRWAFCLRYRHPVHGHGEPGQFVNRRRSERGEPGGTGLPAEQVGRATGVRSVRIRREQS
jgi:hypothetical protein